MQQLEPSAANDYGIATTPKALVVIGASTGGPIALGHILPKLPRTLDAAIVVVQQMRRGFTGLIAQQLNEACEMSVAESSNFQLLGSGSVIFAPGNCNVLIERPGSAAERPFGLRVEDVSQSADRGRRRIDEAMISAATQLGDRVIGVLLTGIGDDGLAGMLEIKKRNGKTIAQDETSSIVFDMPGAAISAGAVDEVVPLWSIPERIVDMVGEI